MKKIFSLIFVSLFFISSIYVKSARALVCGEPIPSNTPPGELTTYITDCQSKLSENRGRQNTLKSAIAYLNTQISLTQAKILSIQKELEKLNIEIDDLTSKIDSIDYSLTDLTKLFVARVRETYIRQEKWTPAIILQANSISEAIRRTEYEQRLRDRDREIMIALEKSRLDYDNQKTEKETKQAEVEKLKAQLDNQKISLSSQKASKDQLLRDTQNDEKKYQALLAQAQAELEAIQNIIAGKGKETEAGPVSNGQRIASLIQGSSCNSSNTHLHFIVSESGSTHNPFNYLSTADYENCSGSSCGSSDGDSFNPSGDWSWPISPKIKMTQGYGSTWATRNTWVGRIYSFHNGIDISGSSSEVKAVKSGTLYRGSYTGSGGCALRYVRVDHDNSNLDTFYLHVNY